MKSNKPLSRKNDLLTQETNGEVMVYDLNTNKAFCLNETSAIIWELCNGKNSISDISAGLGKKLNSSASEDLVWLAIDQLKKDNLIANVEELENKFEGMSRRDVIKKVGLGTMIALPIVAGLTAPKAINAASGVCPAQGSTVNGVFQRGQGSFCRCTAGTAVQGQTCTPNPDTANPGDPQICASGCRCVSTQTGTPNGNCAQ